MNPDVAISTVAMSLFSLLNVQGPALFAHARESMALQGFSCGQDELEAAVRELINRRLITMIDGTLSSRYARGWVVATRNRDDASGWGGWVMKQLSTGEHRLLANMRPEN